MPSVERPLQVVSHADDMMLITIYNRINQIHLLA